VSLLDALLDAIDAKSEAVARFADAAVESMRDDVHAVIAVAARRGATPAQVRAAAGTRLVRAELVALVEFGMQARHLAERVVGDMEQKAGAHRIPRRGPIRAADLEERRTRRTPRADEASPAAPALADIAGLTDAQLVTLLRRYGIRLDPERLFAANMERITEQLIAANVPDDTLVARVAKTAELRLRQHMQHEAKAAVRAASTQRLGIGRTEGGALMWTAVMDAATCESCEARHGEMHTQAEWEELGLPGDSALVCDGNCRCELVPSEWVAPEEDITVKLTLEVTPD